jgi:DNA-binding MarR family transcriptional regulator
MRWTTVRDIRDDILLALRQISQATDLQSRALLLRCGLTGPQLIVLRELERSGQVPIGSLARRVSLSQATVTGIVERLEKRGLVERTRDHSDRRRVLVQSTKEGREVSENAPSVLQERFAEELLRLADWEQNLILSSLQRVSAMMQADRLSAEQILIRASERTEFEIPDVAIPRDDARPGGYVEDPAI